MAKKRIPRLQTDQAVAAYWDTHSFTKHTEGTTAAAIRFVKQSKRAIVIRLDPATWRRSRP